MTLNDKLRKVNKQLAEACRSVLEQYGDESCRYDHHNYCQTHNLAEGEDCWAVRIKAALAAQKEVENGM